MYALYGYEAMRIALDAVGGSSGPDERAAVTRQALRPRTLHSVLGTYTVQASGDLVPARFGSYRRGPGALEFLGWRGPSGALLPAGRLGGR